MVNLYIPGTARVPLADGNEVTLEQRTDIRGAARSVSSFVRYVPWLAGSSPAFPSGASRPVRRLQAKVGGKARNLPVHHRPGGRVTISLTLDMRCRLVRSPRAARSPPKPSGPWFEDRSSLLATTPRRKHR